MSGQPEARPAPAGEGESVRNRRAWLRPYRCRCPQGRRRKRRYTDVGFSGHLTTWGLRRMPPHRTATQLRTVVCDLDSFVQFLAAPNCSLAWPYLSVPRRSVHPTLPSAQLAELEWPDRKSTRL